MNLRPLAPKASALARLSYCPKYHSTPKILPTNLCNRCRHVFGRSRSRWHSQTHPPFGPSAELDGCVPQHGFHLSRFTDSADNWLLIHVCCRQSVKVNTVGMARVELAMLLHPKQAAYHQALIPSVGHVGVAPTTSCTPSRNAPTCTCARFENGDHISGADWHSWQIVSLLCLSVFSRVVFTTCGGPRPLIAGTVLSGTEGARIVPSAFSAQRSAI